MWKVAVGGSFENGEENLNMPISLKQSESHKEWRCMRRLARWEARAKQLHEQKKYIKKTKFTALTEY